MTLIISVSSSDDAIVKKIKEGAAISYIERQYKAGGTPDKTGSLVYKAGTIENVVLAASGKVKSLEIAISGYANRKFTLAEFLKSVNRPLPKAGEGRSPGRFAAIRFGNKAVKTARADALKARIAKLQDEISELKGELKSLGK